MLPLGSALVRFAPAYVQAPASTSTSGSACSDLDPCAGLYIRTAKLVQGIPVVTSIPRPSDGASSSSSSTVSPDQDSFDDYPEIGISTFGDSAREGCLIFMVAPAENLSNNNSSRYPTIRRSEASDARMPDHGMIQNLNPDFNVVWLQTIMELIQCMAPEGSPLVALAQQGAEVANLTIAEKSANNPRREPSIGND
jgi:hypothetical protein